MAKLSMMVAVLSCLCLAKAPQAAVYMVGDAAGWDISSSLDTWTSGKTFTVGDVLLFQYSSLHDVNQVNKAGFNNCSATNALLSSRDGNTSIPLTSPGPKYFICGTLSHCLGGMKLQVNVNGKQAASPAVAPEGSAGGVPPPGTRPTNRNTGSAVPSSGFSARVPQPLPIAFALLWTLVAI